MQGNNFLSHYYNKLRKLDKSEPNGIHLALYVRKVYLVNSKMENSVEEKFLADSVLDTRGFGCAWSILKAKSELKRMKPGQILAVLSTDPLTLKDFSAILRETEDEVFRVDEGPDFFSLYVRKGNSSAVRSLSGRRQDLEEL